ncbi:MAG: hypothetical protein WCV90_01455 [Candidatus Woesearchaeota archaeon]|jgi:hypothetical protein
MHPFFKKVEKINHHLIFPAILVLLVIIVLELFFHVENETAILVIEIADYLVLVVFVIDLGFLAIHAKSTKFFFKNYWLDILAVFPFSIAFGFMGGIYRLLSVSEETVVMGQVLFHEGLEVEKAAAKTEKFAKIGREFKVGARVVRIFTKTRFFSRFHRKKKEHLRV